MDCLFSSFFLHLIKQKQKIPLSEQFQNPIEKFIERGENAVLDFWKQLIFGVRYVYYIKYKYNIKRGGLGP
jgi:hypothetical protein